MFPDFSFDGCGINGKDEFRTRLATLTEAGKAQGVGPLFASADKLLAALRALRNCCELNTDELDPETLPAIRAADIALAEAEPDGPEAAYLPDEKQEVI